MANTSNHTIYTPENLLISCGYCDKKIYLNKAKETEYGYFCSDCEKDLKIKCDFCEENFYEFLTAEVSGKPDGKVCCDNCLKTKHFKCVSCLIYFENGKEVLEPKADSLGTPTGDYYKYCEECYELREINGQIHDYTYLPKLKFSKMPWENTFYLGVELEINTFDVPTNHSKQFKGFLKRLGVQDRFFFKKDGSIHGGYEIVTHPFTLQDAHKNIPWKEILTWLRKNKATSYESGECGLHVHVSRNTLSSLDIAKIKLFFWRCRKEIERFSKRKNFEYCRIEPFSKDMVKHMVNGNYIQDGRRVAVNVENDKGTVEFRIFRGTLSYKRFMASLQFSEAICEFVKEYGVGAIDTDKAWGYFMEFLHKKGNYKLLEDYLKGYVTPEVKK